MRAILTKAISCQQYRPWRQADIPAKARGHQLQARNCGTLHDHELLWHHRRRRVHQNSSNRGQVNLRHPLLGATSAMTTDTTTVIPACTRRPHPAGHRPEAHQAYADRGQPLPSPRGLRGLLAQPAAAPSAPALVQSNADRPTT